MAMRFAIVFGVALVVVLTVRELRQIHPPTTPAQVAGVVPTQPAPHPPGRPVRPPPVKLPPTVPTLRTAGSTATSGSYVPRGFDPNFRQRIVADLGRDINSKLGRDFSVAKRVQIAEVQNRFWDV